MVGLDQCCYGVSYWSFLVSFLSIVVVNRCGCCVYDLCKVLGGFWGEIWLKLHG